MRLALVLAAACAPAATGPGGSVSAPGRAARADDDPAPAFCEALRIGDQMAATDALRDALIATGASKQRDATDALASWLRGVPCAYSVEVDPVLIDVEPPVRKLKVVVKFGTDRVACDAELRLTVGGQVALIGCKPLRGA